MALVDLVRVGPVQPKWWPGLAALVGANLVPVAGLLAFGWDLSYLLLVYWSESVVVFAFSIAKGILAWRKAAFGLVPFFCVHAGMFMGVHLVFLLTLFVDVPAGGWPALLRDLGWATLAFVASHLVSFLANVVLGDERPAPGGGMDPMRGFYQRVVVMHLTILGGAFLLVLLGTPAVALLLLVLLKTAVDVVAHLRERQRAADANATEVVTPDGPLRMS